VRRTAIAIAMLLAVAGCGRRETLQPAEGVALPPKQAEARVQPTVDELLTPTQTARPGRSEEILRKSQIRQDDRFDLPPRG
jgi:predicted small lipoprotein YifL